MRHTLVQDQVTIEAGDVRLQGDLVVPDGSTALVIFAHGSGSSRLSPRNRHVAQTLNESGLSTLLFDLLTSDEQVIDDQTRHLRFDIDLLADRLVRTIDWVQHQPHIRDQRIGLFGASTGAAAAIVAAAERPRLVHAVVSRGGRPDLAGPALGRLEAPILMIVGGEDEAVIGLNRNAGMSIRAKQKIEIVPGATHLFEEPGALEKVADLAASWLARHLSAEVM